LQEAHGILSHAFIAYFKMQVAAGGAPGAADYGDFLAALKPRVEALTTGRLLAAGITINWKPQSVLPAVQGYPVRLRAMFKALIDNALEAMNTKGWRVRELTVTTRTLGGSLPGNVEILIEDSGPGIPPELYLKVFEPFFTTRNGGGHHAGTGLAMAQQVVSDHGGMIEIETVPTGGCRMRVVLPTRRAET